MAPDIDDILERARRRAQAQDQEESEEESEEESDDEFDEEESEWETDSEGAEDDSGLQEVRCPSLCQKLRRTRRWADTSTLGACAIATSNALATRFGASISSQPLLLISHNPPPKGGVRVSGCAHTPSWVYRRRAHGPTLEHHDSPTHALTRTRGERAGGAAHRRRARTGARAVHAGALSRGPRRRPLPARRRPLQHRRQGACTGTVWEAFCGTGRGSASAGFGKGYNGPYRGRRFLRLMPA
jgi:hypothetical protein